MNDLVISGTMLEEIRMTAAELRLNLAVYLYDKEKLTISQSKKIANLTQIEFQKELSKRNVFIKYDISDLEDDLKTLNQLD